MSSAMTPLELALEKRSKSPHTDGIVALLQAGELRSIAESQNEEQWTILLTDEDLNAMYSGSLPDVGGEEEEIVDNNNNNNDDDDNNNDDNDNDNENENNDDYDDNINNNDKLDQNTIDSNIEVENEQPIFVGDNSIDDQCDNEIVDVIIDEVVDSPDAMYHTSDSLINSDNNDNNNNNVYSNVDVSFFIYYVVWNFLKNVFFFV